jgi:hypothetical protein
MTARIVLRPSILTAFRATVIGVAGFVGAWDVGRLVSDGSQSPTTIDLLTCPVVPLMRIVAGWMNISDTFLVSILFIGNAVIYGAIGYLLVFWLQHRISTVGVPKPR